jgi:hypothetical protein
MKLYKTLGIFVGAAAISLNTFAAEVNPASTATVKPVQCTYANGVAKLGDVVQNQPGMPKGMAMVCANVRGTGTFLVVAKSSLKSL